MRDFTSPWSVAAKRAKAASILAWDEAIRDASDHARRKGGKPHGGSQPEPAPDFFQGDVVARFRKGQIQLGRSLGIDNFQLTQFGKERNGLILNIRVGRANDPRTSTESAEKPTWPAICVTACLNCGQAARSFRRQ